MIAPYLLGFLDLRKTPITWLLIALNVFFSSALYEQQRNFDKATKFYYTDDSFIKTQGYLYLKYLQTSQEPKTIMLTSIIQRVENGDFIFVKLLANIALRDTQFLFHFNPDSSFGDSLAIEKWKKQRQEFLDIQKKHPNQLWGLSSQTSSWRNWFSYQFVHGGFIHLVSNMFFLLIFGSVVELIIGSAAFLVLFLVSGVVGAWFFLWLTGLTIATLIGASGSISGIMVIAGVLLGTQRVKFLYFIPTKDKFFGFIYLPAWVAVLLWLPMDIAGYLSSVNEFGGIAYAAHIGGAGFGLIAGITIRMIKKTEPIYTLGKEEVEPK